MKLLQERRIPTPCPSNHASNLLELDGGDLLCTWFGGTMEGTPDISIYLARFDTARGQWRDPEKISNDHKRSEQNRTGVISGGDFCPSIIPTDDGRIHIAI